MNLRTGIVKLTLLAAVLLCATVAIGSFWLNSASQSQTAIGANAITFEAFTGEFISSVIEKGDIGSSENVEIRSQVKSRGRTGVAILQLVAEGTKVQKGDFLCQLDDSLLREELTERKISVAKDKADVIQAIGMLDAAKRKLNEFEQGNFQQEQAKFQAAINVAIEREKRAIDFGRHSARLNRKGYVTNMQLQADMFSAETAKEVRILAQEDLRVYLKFSKDRIVAEMNSDIGQQEARLEASRFTLELSEQRATEYEKQVASCRIVAPQSGTVVYANDSDRRDSSIVIEEGVTIRDGQEIFYLPDPTKMQVNAKVSDSKINKVKQGQRVEVRVDASPETSIAGVVRRVSSFPLPQRWSQAPIEYEVFVEITEQSELIRGGLRGKVEIFVERQEDVVLVPVSSLLLSGPDTYFVLVKTESGVEPREVEIGSNNASFVIVKDGVQAGEMVLVDADNYRDSFDLTAIP
ncbi:MAG: HlyD family secretion protein [Mariniblastus sp.]|jgi:HlyD family secretion protein